ncbi:hypothetical protein BN165_350023 [Clostridioides difficile E1]|nr:hypothetical protein BN163_360023 [Clostridioides difficile T5]CCK92878.1 hypothetical protein BN164_330011 [Clostridioides difficile T20]CCK96506.1 hypothetical protein BN165_350023 [Clostridioides difficile E1]CCL00533.1 hypothetical protein BN166_420011 [Clostridioides difficile E10]
MAGSVMFLIGID